MRIVFTFNIVPVVAPYSHSVSSDPLSWLIIAQSMFQLRETNQMVREMCQYLEWELNMNLATLKEFEEMAHKDWGIGSYLIYILLLAKKLMLLPWL